MANELTEPREVRKHLLKVMHGRERVDGRRPEGYSMATSSAILCNTVRWGEAQGWSNEDTMTMLAYQALLAYEAIADRMIEGLNLTPHPPFVIDTPPR